MKSSRCDGDELICVVGHCAWQRPATKGTSVRRKHGQAEVKFQVQGCAIISRLRFEDLDPQVQGLIVPLHVSNELVAQFVLVSVAEYLSAESL